MIKNIVQAILYKSGFKEDMQPQTILLMGLPASGKSTFINQDLSLYYPFIIHVTEPLRLNSDIQLKKYQFNMAMRDYASLMNMSEDEYNKQIESFKYIDNEGNENSFKLPYSDFKAIKSPKEFYAIMSKKYYSNYFGERELARKEQSEVKDRKIDKGKIIIFDTLGLNPEKWFDEFKRAHDNGYINSVIFLDIDMSFAIARDKDRGIKTGRSVGASVIRASAPKLLPAYKQYRQNEYVDRTLHFTWIGEWFKGQYILVEDNKKYPKVRT